MCKRCDAHKISITNPNITDQEKHDLETAHEICLHKAEKARDILKQDEVKLDVDVCSIDMQKALPFPTLTVNEAYYKHNLYTYIIGLHEMKGDQAYCYVWNEMQTSSCLLYTSRCV